MTETGSRLRLCPWLLPLFGVVSFCALGCAPAGSSLLRPLHAAVRPLARPHSGTPAGTVMVATLVPRGAVPARCSGGVVIGAPPDDNGRGLGQAVARLGVARKVVRSPLSRASGSELLRAAQDARASLLVTSQVMSVRLRRRLNAAFAGLLVCALTVGMTLVGIPACMAIPGHTLEAEVELELAIWDVGQGRRVWQQHVRRRGWVSVSSYTARRSVPRAIARGTNAAYRAGLPRLARALPRLVRVIALRAAAKTQKSGVNR